MSIEIAIIAGSSIAGAVLAAALDKLSRFRSSSNKEQPKSSSAARVELASVLFQKNLTAEAITRVYEAYQHVKIDRLERDRLLLKYKQQLDSLNHKIDYLQPVADFEDLAKVRNNLVLLLQEKISALDKKLLEFSKSHVSYERGDTTVKKILDETLEAQVSAPIEQKIFNSDEKSIEQLQKEIVQTLQHLEQVEIDKD